MGHTMIAQRQYKQDLKQYNQNMDQRKIEIASFTPLPSEKYMWERANLKELKALCAERGLSTNHNRSKIIGRLTNWSDNQRFKRAPRIRIPDWDCVCGAKGCFGSRDSCYRCYRPNPYWFQCECGKVNHPNKSACVNCGFVPGLSKPKDKHSGGVIIQVHQAEAESDVCDLVPALPKPSKKVTRKNHLQQMRESKVNVLTQRNMELFEKKRQKELQKSSPPPSVCSESVSSERIDDVRVPSFSLKFQNDDQRPEWFLLTVGQSYSLTGPTTVRAGISFWNSESPVTYKLDAGTCVHVDKFEQVEFFDSGRFVDRAYITSPVQGWISVRSNNKMRLSKVGTSESLI